MKEEVAENPGGEEAHGARATWIRVGAAGFEEVWCGSRRHRPEEEAHHVTAEDGDYWAVLLLQLGGGRPREWILLLLGAARGSGNKR